MCERKRDSYLCLAVSPIKSRVILAVVPFFCTDMRTEGSMQWKLALVLPLLSLSSFLLAGSPCRMPVAVQGWLFHVFPHLPCWRKRAGAAIGMEIGVYITPLLLWVIYSSIHLFPILSWGGEKGKCSTCLRKLKWKKSHLHFLICPASVLPACGREDEQKHLIFSLV